VLRVLSDELRDHSIVVETDLEADLPMVEADTSHSTDTNQTSFITGGAMHA